MTTNKYFNKNNDPEKEVLENWKDILEDADPEYYLDELDYVIANLCLDIQNGDSKFEDVFPILKQISFISMEKGQYALTGFDKVEYSFYNNQIQTFKDGFLFNLDYHVKNDDEFIKNAIENKDFDFIKDIHNANENRLYTFFYDNSVRYVSGDRDCEYINPNYNKEFFEFIYNDNDLLSKALEHDLDFGSIFSKRVLEKAEPEKIDLLTSWQMEYNIIGLMEGQPELYLDSYKYLIENNDEFKKSMNHKKDMKIDYEREALSIEIGKF